MSPQRRRFWKREPNYPTRQQIFAALDANGWHAGRASRTLGIGRATLWRRLRAWGISLRKNKKKVWSGFWFDERIEQWARRTGRRGIGESGTPVP